MQSSRILLPLFLLLASCFFLLACNETPAHIRHAVELYHAGQFAQSATVMAPEAQKKDETFVLNSCRYGSCALAAGQYAQAETAFSDAYQVINSVKTNDPGRSLGAAIVFEGLKVWKGEPFERAMAHYYLGVLNLLKEQPDYENARVAFRGSLFKLREYAKDDSKKSEEEQYKEFESNFALGYFGLGLAYARDNNPDQADANFNQAVKINSNLAPLVAAAKDPRYNVVLFIDVGQGPRRHKWGLYGCESAFGPPPEKAPPIPAFALVADGQPIVANVPGTLDTLALAQEQKWQDIDTIRTAKAAIGTGALVGGGAVAGYGAARGNSGMALAGLGIMAAGALISASSQADLRYWEMLPRTVYVVPCTLPPGTHTIQPSLNGATAQPITITIRPGAPTYTYLRIP